jgi:nitrogen fixation-related uncharacterized protein
MPRWASQIITSVGITIMTAAFHLIVLLWFVLQRQFDSERVMQAFGVEGEVSHQIKGNPDNG